MKIADLLLRKPRTKTVYLVFALAAFMLACTSKESETIHLSEYFATDTSKVQAGGVTMVPVTTPAGTHNVWTKRIGNNPKIKVMLLAGGPGFPHDYLEVFESFFPKEGIEFYYYDELGSGNSDKPVGSSSPTWFLAEKSSIATFRKNW